jgi:MerR family transcriptional regulator, redox-sensitive transcriptional activator SoxR
MAIGEVAQRAGLRPSAIRFYERAGLLPSPPRESGRRRYDPSVLERLRVIEVCKQAGFSLSETERLMSGFADGVPASERWRQLATDKLGELDALVERVGGMRALLRRGLECDCLRLEDCELLAERR